MPQKSFIEQKTDRVTSSSILLTPGDSVDYGDFTGNGPVTVLINTQAVWPPVPIVVTAIYYDDGDYVNTLMGPPPGLAFNVAEQMLMAPEFGIELRVPTVFTVLSPVKSSSILLPCPATRT